MKGIDIETTGLDHNSDRILYVGQGDGLGVNTFHNGKFDTKFCAKLAKK